MRTPTIDEENMILSVGREFLPPFAIAVLDGGVATDEYCLWLENQLTQITDDLVTHICPRCEWRDSEHEQCPQCSYKMEVI